MGQNSWRQQIDMNDWMGAVEKRMMAEERRPIVRTAADILGPGFGPFSVELLDWNDDAAAFNGSFFSQPGAINTPDVPNDRHWMGFVNATEDGFGLQRVVDYRVATWPGTAWEWARKFFDPGTGGTRTYSSWSLVSDSRLVGEFLFYASETPPNDRYLFCDGSEASRTGYPELYALVGTTHGVGDGSSTFNLPDGRSRLIRGADAANQHPYGEVDILGPDARTTRHIHSITAMNDHHHGAGTLQTGTTPDRAAGGLGRATSAITGNTGESGEHDHGGSTGLSDPIPHISIPMHIRARS